MARIPRLDLARLVAGLLVVLAPIESLTAQQRMADCDRSAGRIALQLLAGTAGAWIGGMGAWKLFDRPEGSDRRVDGDAGYTPNANTAFALGSWAGSTAGVYLAEPRRKECGSLLGTATGTGVASIPLFLGRHNGYLPILGVAFGAPLQAVAGTVTFRWRW